MLTLFACQGEPDLGTFLKSVSGHRLEAAWNVAAMTGMRRGEVLGLRWNDVDLDAGAPVKVITERLGHESPAFTLKQYAHVIPGMQADAARTVASTIRDATPRSDDRPQTTRLTFDTGLS